MTDPDLKYGRKPHQTTPLWVTGAILGAIAGAALVILVLLELNH
jgi:hypothetical protein